MPDIDITQPRLFTSPEVARLSGNTSSRIEAWTRLAILIPDQSASRGGSRLFSLFSVIEANRNGLLADRDMGTAQLQVIARDLRARINATVRPAPGFDLHARAAYGFLIETIRGITGMYGLSGDPVIKRFLRSAEQRHQNKNFWRIEHLNSPGNTEALLAGFPPAAA